MDKIDLLVALTIFITFFLEVLLLQVVLMVITSIMGVPPVPFGVTCGIIGISWLVKLLVE